MNFLPQLGRKSRPEIDLHMHSVQSDGSSTPSELVEMALTLKLVAIALTDHDTTAGVSEARRAAEGTGLEVIAGVELSANEGRSDVHLLVYECDRDLAGLEAELQRFRHARLRRAEGMVAKLNDLGMTVTMADVQSFSGPGTIGRPHVANALVLRGHVEHPQEAFRKYIGHGGPAFVPKEEFTPQDALDLAAKFGGKVVLAHPGTLRRDDLIPGLKEMGLTGIEVWHPRHDESARQHYLSLARKHGLVPTGGSDYHGSRNPGVELGCSHVPADILPELRAAGVPR